MYDLAPPSMKAQFNLINISNQRFKLLVNILDKGSPKKGLLDYKYNNFVIFKYYLKLENSHFVLNIYKTNSKINHFNRVVLGAFVYDISLKYSISSITIESNNKLILQSLAFGFLQKDFIYTKYKSKSKFSKFKTNYKLSNNNQTLLDSIKFLKELVSEPSNVIYPASFESS